MSVLTEGLQSPDGIVVDPVSGDIFVAEETAGAVTRIRAGRRERIISAGSFRIETNLPDWLITAEYPRTHWLQNRLNAPEGLARGPEGTLYVVEDTPRGRVLEFVPNAQGRYASARIVPVPWLDEPYAWEGVCASADGRLYLAGSSLEAEGELGSSCVLARNASNDWWVVDYGSFAGFSSVAASTEESVLVAADEIAGGLTWWDVRHRKELQTFTKELGRLEGVCILPDGSLALAQETSEQGGRLLRCNPLDGSIEVLAEGLGSIESVACEPGSGRILVTEDSTGRLLAFTPDGPYGPKNSLLQVARRGGEARLGLPPRQTPGFLKEFMQKVGVQLLDDGETPSGSAAQNLTLEQLGKHIPLVAGRVRVGDMPGVEDPITEISFINLYPNQVTMTDHRPTPSLCLFQARHRSGRVDRSQPLTGFHASKRDTGGKWKSISHDAMLMLPLTTCSAVEDDNGVTVTMSFLGLDRFGDCFLTINYGRRNEATFAVAGERLAVAPATFSEKAIDGPEVVHFAMTGIRPRRAEDATWLRIGNKPRWSLVSPGLDVWFSRWTLAHLPDMVSRLRAYNRQVLASCSELPEPGASIATRSPESTLESTPSKAPDVQQPPPPRRREDPAVGAIKFPPPSAPDDGSLTNLLIGRITEWWQRGE